MFKKDCVIDKDRLSNWVNIIKKEFSNWTDNQINQINSFFFTTTVTSILFFKRFRIILIVI